ncbi:MAG: hypothetical protein ACF8PN_05560 [Phycisphaerales bacterium]
MPRPGMRWRHATLSTRRSWMPGDPRGFRNRKHRIHSSGDYRNPPPEQEHIGLRWYNANRLVREPPVEFGAALRPIVGATLLRDLVTTSDCRVAALAVAGTHLHVLVEGPADDASFRRVIGVAKRAASMRVRDELPGRIWADGGHFKNVDSDAYQREVFAYIVNHRAEGAWVWTYRDEFPADAM